MNSDSPKYKVPVLSGERVIELAGRERVACLLNGSNVRAIRGGHKKRQIVALEILDFGDNHREKSRGASASKYTHDNENDDNPPRVITFRYLDPRFWVRWTVTGKAT